MNADMTAGTHARIPRCASDGDREGASFEGASFEGATLEGAGTQVTSANPHKQAWRRRWRGVWGCAALAVMVGGCRTTGTIGATDCYVVLRLDAELEQPLYHISGVRAEVIDPDCPPLSKVDCTFWDDRNGNRKLDPGETLTQGTFAESDPPSHTLTAGAFSGRRAGAGRATCWQCEVVAGNNQVTRFGGTF